MRNALQRSGYGVVDRQRPADLTIINSCAVTRRAEAKTRGAITAARKVSPRGRLIVVGCYAQYDPATLSGMEGVDLVLGNREKAELLDFLPLLERGKTGVHVSRDLQGSRLAPPESIADGDRVRAEVKVQEGCDYGCSYCIIPYLRGSSRSRGLSECLAEVDRLVARGYREVVLSGINISTYHTADGKDFTALVNRILEKTAIERLRISSIEPNLIPDLLIELMRSEKRLCRHFHIPLQHGSSPMLTRMKRRYTISDYRSVIDRIIDRVPDVCIGADVLVGYPGETQQLFGEMVTFIEQLPVAYLHVFRYSERPLTEAADLPEKVSEAVKKRRSRILRQLSRLKREHFVRRFVGRELLVLFEEKDQRGKFRGLADNYIRVLARSEESLSNEIRRVKITASQGKDLLGEIVRG